ncbi:ABC-type phosphate transport system, substrate-binding protein [Solimonas aquatica]|uniref:ABC-type phosphate transport system, substrate-binding protein n=1 Tax=Solimonas aquatica TaxID=489703 RepID=A0A1H9DMK0_9GAMM|nr:substrate-binding domain-containing protein [Solimonas aquatica]SEQ14726.1 ABC-type phosphate transport system, substrate-binding protein [Solimonas aquatica]
MKSIHQLFRIAAVAAVLAAPSAFAATATPPATVLYGGGATFPAEAYIGSTFLGVKTALPTAARLSVTNGIAAPSGVTTATADKGSLFGAFAVLNNTIGAWYCQTGSGTGKNVLTGGSAGTVLASGACGDYGSTPAGFGAPSGVEASFAGTDEPLSTSDITNFNTNKAATHTELVQIPSTIGSIAIVYNNSDLGKTKLNLTRSDICGIFSGAITNWSQLTHTPKYTAKAKAINLVVRSDSSGTTFNLTNFLSAACPSLALPGDTAYAGFKMNKVFTTSFLSGFTAPTVDAQSGNGGVVSRVNAVDGSIGYADVADAAARAKLAGSKVTYATVAYAADVAKSSLVLAPSGSGSCPNGTYGKRVDKTVGPITTVTNPSSTKTLKFTCPAITYNKLDPAKNLLAKGTTGVALTAQADKLMGSVGSNGRQALDSAAYTPAGVAGCVQVVDPAALFAAPAATKKAAADVSTYPLVALTYLVANSTGNGANTAALKSLLKTPYDTATLAKTKTIGKTSGYAPLTLTLGGGYATPAALIDACIQN